ncbi:MAG: MoaD/ThiS family protein [Anaerolineae bacterium]|nr:MoaD/ThiS family protein [Anaerolineae bacterium]
MIRVTLPTHLRMLAKVSGPVDLQVEEPITQRTILDALEAAYPMLRGTIRDPATKERRPFIRFFACGEDISLDSVDAAVPVEVCAGKEPFRIIGALAGG